MQGHVVSQTWLKPSCGESRPGQCIGQCLRWNQRKGLMWHMHIMSNRCIWKRIEGRWSLGQDLIQPKGRCLAEYGGH